MTRDEAESMSRNGVEHAVPTLVVFFSLTGSVGKTTIVRQLNDSGSLADGESDATTALDCDLVSARLSRLYQHDAGRVGRVDPDAVRRATEWVQGIIEGHDFNIQKGLLPAAPWVTALHRIETMVSASWRAKPGSGRDGDHQYLLQYYDKEIGNLIGGLEEQIRGAKRAQSRFLRDFRLQQKFWESILGRQLAASRGKRVRHVLVDMPAQGPAGLSLPETWDFVVAAARRLVSNSEAPRGLRIVRVLVTTIEHGRHHPVIENLASRAVRDPRKYEDLIVLTNFSPPAAMIDEDSSADRCFYPDSKSHMFPLADISEDATVSTARLLCPDGAFGRESETARMSHVEVPFATVSFPLLFPDDRTTMSKLVSRLHHAGQLHDNGVSHPELKEWSENRRKHGIAELCKAIADVPGLD